MVSFLDGGGTSHLISKLLGTMYPVGSIYMSVKNTSPAAIFGGTWKRIANGRTLMGVDSADEDFSTPAHTGGAKEVTLTVSQLPPHSHSMSLWSGGHQAGYGPKAESSAPDSAGVNVATTKNTGDGDPIRILPPYYIVYIWQRVS